MSSKQALYKNKKFLSQKKLYHKNPIFSFFPKQKEKEGPDGWKKLILITGTYSDWGLN